MQAEKDALKAAKKEKLAAKQAKQKAEQEQRKALPSEAQAKKAAADEVKVEFQSTCQYLYRDILVCRFKSWLTFWTVPLSCLFSETLSLCKNLANLKPCSSDLLH